MLKNKFKIIAFLAIIILALTLPIVRADDETTDSTTTLDVIAENPTNDNSVSTTTDENF